MKKIDELIEKYDFPVPRYTSYPTVPDWNLQYFDQRSWKSSLNLAYQKHNNDGVSLYIHLPYCESLCTYCGCNTRITVNHAVERPYVEAVIKEFQMIKKVLGRSPKLKELHLGGGTPTFFSPENLKFLINGLLSECQTAGAPEMSFEGHPNNTTKVHLTTLFELGFRRVSFGIQDSDIKVQQAINRIQPDSAVRKVTQWAREIGYTSINFDLIYGLPFQTLRSITQTMKLVDELSPDRIAFYSYAHVPWKKPGQRAYSDMDLPSPKQKHELNQLGQDLLKKAGYLSIGMDHFALPEDELSIAMQNGRLHRNFMGYTTHPGELLIGLGVSAISDIALAYGQNTKSVEIYMEKIKNEELAQTKGHIMSPSEYEIKRKILKVACEQSIPIESFEDLGWEEQNKIVDFVQDGILTPQNGEFNVTEIGVQFLRNVCAVFDPNQRVNRSQTTFSKAV